MPLCLRKWGRTKPCCFLIRGKEELRIRSTFMLSSKNPISSPWCQRWRQENKKPLFAQSRTIIRGRAKSDQSAFYCISKAACNNFNYRSHSWLVQCSTMKWGNLMLETHCLTTILTKRKKKKEMNFCHVFESKNKNKQPNRRKYLYMYL